MRRFVGLFVAAAMATVLSVFTPVAALAEVSSMSADIDHPVTLQDQQQPDHLPVNHGDRNGSSLPVSDRGESMKPFPVDAQPTELPVRFDEGQALPVDGIGAQPNPWPVSVSGHFTR